MLVSSPIDMSDRKHVNVLTGLLSFLSVICFVSAQWAVEDDGCRTPDRGVGSCIPIHSCEPIVTLLTTAPKPLSQQVVARLRSYQCGFAGSSVKVCCPSNSITLSGSTRQPPETTGHRNLNLINQNCGHSESLYKITGGNVTDIMEFPWMTLLSYQTARGPDFRCGGTIINSRYILTAAHCISNLKFPLLGVRIGEHDIRTKTDCQTNPTGEVCAPPYQDLGIERAIPHPRYNHSSFENDIGLIRVSTPMNLSVDNAKPVCLPTGDWRNYIFGSDSVTVTGWGATETGRQSPELLKVDVPPTSNENCRRLYEGVADINYRQLCAGGKDGKDSCAGDSGGPLHVVLAENDDAVYVQQGVVSFGPRLCGTEGRPAIYTRVAYYMDWILDTIRP